MKNMEWHAYSDLAWTESIISLPEEYVEETTLFSKLIKEHSKIDARTLLHLGCGAGGHDETFKKYFTVTGVDISENMLAIARRRNPEVTYHAGDMQTVRLDECFDAVAIPDSIGYMTTVEELRKTLLTAYTHLKPGGVLLIVTHLREEFRENNFVYTGSRGDIDITVFENNHFLDPERTTYEATFIYLIRRSGKLEIHTDRHIIGLYALETWREFLSEVGLEFAQIKTGYFYNSFLLGEGEYPLSMMVCRKLLQIE